MYDQVLIVDDQSLVVDYLEALLLEEGFDVVTANDGAKALRILEDQPSMLVLCDIRMPGMDGFQLLDEIRARHCGADVIFMTAFASVDEAIEAMSRGAVDYMIKPIKNQEVVAKVRSHLHRRRLASELQELQAEMRSRYDINRLVANSNPMRAVVVALRKATLVEDPVVFVGPRGSGRNLVAGTLHYSGARHASPLRLLQFDCTGPTNFDEELFGVDRPDQRPRRGHLDEVGNGTLCIRGTEMLPADNQRSLARLLKSRSYRRVGSGQEIALHARLTFSFAEPVDDLLADGRLLPELSILLRAITIHLPPLSERREDIPDLVASYVSRHTLASGDSIRIPSESMELILEGSYPGNVAQLFALLEHCRAMSPDGMLTREIVEQALRRVGPETREAPKRMAESLEDREYQLVLDAVSKHRGQLEVAARELGVSRTTLWRRMRKYDIRAQGSSSKSAPH